MLKVGGSLDGDVERACSDVAELVGLGHQVVVVHGGGAEADRLATALGRPPRHLTSTRGRRSRYTDAAALDALTMAMLGRVKPGLVTALHALGVPAVGLSGADSGLVVAARTPPVKVLVDGEVRVVRDDLSGRITSVRPELLTTLTRAGYVPVVSPPALGETGGLLNVDADRFAAALAVATGADWLIILSDVPGLLREPGDPESLVARIPADRLSEHLDLAVGRMKVKLRTAAEAYGSGVPHVVLADGRVDSPVLRARSGAGTTFAEGVR